jgi:death on curing protein
VIFPTREQIVSTNRDLISISVEDVFNEPENLMFPEKLEWVLYAIQNPFFGIDEYPSIIEKASLLSWKINSGHIFYNANKRTSIAVLLLFLQANGFDLDLGDKELIEISLRVCNSSINKYSYEEYVEYLNNHVRPLFM